MRANLINLFCACFILIIPVSLNSQDKLRVGITGFFDDAMGYYGLDENLHRDLTTKQALQYYSTDYTFEYSAYKFEMFCDYPLKNDWTINLKLPVTYRSLSEDSKEDASGTSNNLCNYSDCLIEYIGIGGTKKFSFDSTTVKAKALLKIPTKYYHSVYNEPGFDFYYGGAFELDLGGEFQKRMNGMDYGGIIELRLRDEELSNQLVVGYSLGFNAIERAELKIGLNFTTALASFRNAREFDPKVVSTKEDYLEPIISFVFPWSDHLSSNCSYSSRIAGKNTLNLNTFTVSLFYDF